MAALILAMLFIGAGMAATVSQRYQLLVSIHKPLGIAILLLALVRLVNRLIFAPPALPRTLPRSQRLAARASHHLLYSLMLLIPLIGWGMLSAADYPVMLSRSLQLAPILPPAPALYAVLRQLHRYFAWLLFLTILLHLAAALFHALIRRDGVFGSMAPWRWKTGTGAGHWLRRNGRNAVRLALPYALSPPPFDRSEKCPSKPSQASCSSMGFGPTDRPSAS
jgi:cytochrome b561